MTIQIETPVDLIASLPAIMGFIPSEMFIPVVFTPMDTILLALKVSVGAQEEVFLHARGVMEEAEGGHHATVVCVGPNPQDPDFPRDYVFSMIPPRMRKIALDDNEVEVYATPSMEPGAPVVAVHHEGGLMYVGELPNWKDQETTSKRVLDGQTILGSETDIFDYYLAEDNTTSDADAPGMSPEAWAKAGFPEDQRPSNAMIGEYIAADVENRDRILGYAMSGDWSFIMDEFATVARNTEHKPRIEALTVAGILAYCQGRGGHAQAAFILAINEADVHGEVPVLATLARTMLTNGIHPREMQDVCRVYRDKYSG